MLTMECPLCGHAETFIYGKTAEDDVQYTCPACHEIFIDSDRENYTVPRINLLHFRDRLLEKQEQVVEPKPVGWLDLLTDAGIVAAFTIAQSVWLTLLISPKIGLINLLPTFIFLAAWYLFVKTDIQKYTWFAFALGFVLTLRLPLTISRSLEPVNWVIYAIAIGLILQRIISYFKREQKISLLIATVAIVLFNSFTHISLNSPFTYSFRMVLGTPSHHVSGQDNNSTWECPYDFTDAATEIVVHCDMRHFIASEKIFTLPNYDASFAVFLKRFFYGYLSSLTGFQGNRWFASFILNIVFWLLTCAAMFRICMLTNLRKINENIPAIATLCCATSWGFVSFVAQPSPYLLAYAFTTFMVWMSLEIIYGDRDELNQNGQKLNIRQLALFAVITFAASLTYELYPVALACIIILLIYRQFAISAVILAGQIISPLVWSKVFLQKVLGTIGVQEGVAQNIPMSIKAWTNVLTQLNYSQAAQYIAKGSLSFLYGGMIFGTLAAVALIAYLLIQLRAQRSVLDTATFEGNKIILILCACFSILFFLAGIFLAPTAQFWSPTGMIPRFLYYPYAANTIALAAIATITLKKYAYIVPVLTFLVANVSLFGIASLTYFADYGVVGLYWR
jgi:hypothetical protein